MNVARSVASRCARSVARRVTDLGDGSSTPGRTTANGQSTSLTIDEGDTLTIDAVITRDPAPWGANEVEYQLQFFEPLEGWSDVDAPQAGSEFDLGAAELSDIGQHRIVVTDTVTSREYPLRAVSVGVTEAPSTLEFLQGTVNGTDATELTFAAQSLGEPAADRLIIVCVHGRSALVSLVSAVTVAGITATKVVEHIGGTPVTGPSSVSAIFVAAVPSGTVGDIVVTYSATSIRSGIQVYRCTGIDSTPSYTHTTAVAVTTDVAVNSIAISAANVLSGSGASWTGLTKNHEATVETLTLSSASMLFSESFTSYLIDDVWMSGGANFRSLVIFEAA